MNRASAGQFYRVIQPLDRPISEILKQSQFNLAAALPAIKANPEIHHALEPWFGCGFRLRESEGIYYTDLDSASLVEFAPELSPDMSAWVSFMRMKIGFTR